MAIVNLFVAVPTGIVAFAACDDESHPPADPIVTGDAGPNDPNKAARAAVVLGSCVPDDGIHRYLSNIYYAHTEDPAGRAVYLDSVECLATRNNGCQAVTDCTGVVVDVAEGCQRGCEGNRLTYCDDALRTRVDCARFGMECRAQGNLVACALPGANACTPPDGGSPIDCVDGKPHTCDSRVEVFGPKCADYGLACSDGQCRGTGGACEGRDSYGDVQSFAYADGVTCTNGTLEACVNKGRTNIACSKLSPDFTCQERTRDGGAPVAYCGLGSACEAPNRKNVTCEGDSVVVCNAGRIDKVDCKSLGFAGCDARALGCVPNIASP